MQNRAFSCCATVNRKNLLYNDSVLEKLREVVNDPSFPYFTDIGALRINLETLCIGADRRSCVAECTAQLVVNLKSRFL